MGGVVGVDRRGHARLDDRLAETDHVGAPIAGDHGIGARGVDLGGIGCEVLDLADRMQLVADDLDIRALLAEEFHRRGRHSFAEGVILTDDVDLADRLVRGDDVGQCIHLDVGIGVETEMPEIAFLVGQRRIDCRVVQEQHALVGIAPVVLDDRVGERVGDAGTVALEDEADAFADCTLELDQAFLGADLVVQRHHLERPPAEHAALRVDQRLDRIFEGAKPRLAGGRERPGERIDEGQTDRVRGADRRGHRGQQGNARQPEYHPTQLGHVILPRIASAETRPTPAAESWFPETDRCQKRSRTDGQTYVTDPPVRSPAFSPFAFHVLLTARCDQCRLPGPCDPQSSRPIPLTLGRADSQDRMDQEEV